MYCVFTHTSHQVGAESHCALSLTIERLRRDFPKELMDNKKKRMVEAAVEFAERLLKANIDLRQDKHGKTALTRIAEWTGNLDMRARLLKSVLKFGCNVNHEVCTQSLL
jgi:hypothetical protein